VFFVARHPGAVVRAVAMVAVARLRVFAVCSFSVETALAGCAKQDVLQGKKVGFSPKDRVDPSRVSTGSAGGKEMDAAHAAQSRLGDDFEVGSFGEDAGFIATRSSLASWFGVADGVGGWRKHGVDPSIFSYGLMDRTCTVATHFDNRAAAAMGAGGGVGDDGEGDGGGPSKITAASLKEELAARALSTAGNKAELQARLDAADAAEACLPLSAAFESSAGAVLARGYDALVQSREVKAGSSTACIGSICHYTGKFSSANLGDSSWLLIRGGKVIMYSEEKRHSFWTPLQLTIAPDGYGRPLTLPATPTPTHTHTLVSVPPDCDPDAAPKFQRCS
jgi:serine/threonine protein phosphatase PrpC